MDHRGVIAFLPLLAGAAAASAGERPLTDELWGPVCAIDVGNHSFEVLTWAGRVPVRFHPRTILAERESFPDFSRAAARGEDARVWVEPTLDGGWRPVRVQIFATTNRFEHGPPGPDRPWFCGRLVEAEGPRAVLQVGDRRLAVDAVDDPMDIHLYRRVYKAFVRPGIDAAEVEGTVTNDAVRARFVGIYRQPTHFRPEDDPALPRVLVVGDSVSSQWYWPLRRRLADEVNLHRIEGQGGTTANALEHLPRWLGPHWLAPYKWDLVVFNFGLHDLRKTDRQPGSWTTPLDDYQQHLHQIVRQLDATGATLLWLSTTPVPGPPGLHTYLRDPGDARTFNQAASEALRDRPDILRCDLWQRMQDPAFDTWRRGRDVHVPDPLKRLQAEHIAESIRRALRQEP